MAAGRLSRVQQIRVGFEKSILSAEGLVSDVRKLERVRTSTRQGVLHSKRVARIAELAFMGMFAAWEEFLEDTFIRYLAGASDSGPGGPILKLGKSEDMKHAYKVLSGKPDFNPEKNTMSWTSPQVVIERAEVFFAGGRPYKQCLAANRSLLEQAKHIRNRTAHSSDRCRRQFKVAALALLGKPGARKFTSGFTAGRLLLTINVQGFGASTTGQTCFGEYARLFRKLAGAIVR